MMSAVDTTEAGRLFGVQMSDRSRDRIWSRVVEAVCGAGLQVHDLAETSPIAALIYLRCAGGYGLLKVT